MADKQQKNTNLANGSPWAPVDTSGFDTGFLFGNAPVDAQAALGYLSGQPMMGYPFSGIGQAWAQPQAQSGNMFGTPQYQQYAQQQQQAAQAAPNAHPAQAGFPDPGGGGVYQQHYGNTGIFAENPAGQYGSIGGGGLVPQFGSQASFGYAPGVGYDFNGMSNNAGLATNWFPTLSGAEQAWFQQNPQYDYLEQQGGQRQTQPTQQQTPANSSAWRYAGPFAPGIQSSALGIFQNAPPQNTATQPNPWGGAFTNAMRQIM